MSKAENTSIGYSEIRFFKIKNMKEKQITHLKTKSRGWERNWIVIGVDYMGDFFFVDTESPNLPVFISGNENVEWKKYEIATSLENFSRILSDLKKISLNRENPNLINQNPISESELEQFFLKIKSENNRVDIEYWEVFLEKD